MQNLNYRNKFPIKRQLPTYVSAMVRVRGQYGSRTWAIRLTHVGKFRFLEKRSSYFEFLLSVEESFY